MPTTTAPSVAKSSSKGRFELPVLAALPSLTAGTDIPPPPDSPIEEKSPTLPTKPEAENVSAVAEGAANGNGTLKVNGTNATVTTEPYSGRGRTSTNHGPASPVSSTRPSSIRRFLSRKSMYNSYANGANSNTSSENVNSPGGPGFRPDSPSAFSTATSKKRSSSWFRRTFTNGGDEPPNKRTSVVYEEKPRGPPPPMLPELDQLKSKVLNDEGSLGAEDMFKRFD